MSTAKQWGFLGGVKLLMKKQTIKLMTTMTGSEELTAHFLAFIRRLTEDGWSIDINVSEGGGCWQIEGEREVKNGTY